MVASNKASNYGLISAYQSLPNVIYGPKSVLFYGGLGLLPFISIPIYLSVTGKFFPELLHANTTYGAGILTYLGAVRWGFAIPNSKDKTLKPTFKTMGWAVTPSIVGWISLLIPQIAGNQVLFISFLMCILQDVYSSAYPAWYKSFRLIFSTTAALSLGMGLLLFHHKMQH